MTQPIEATITAVESIVTVTAAMGSAGQALAATPSSSVRLARGNIGGPIEYKVGAGAWVQLDRNEGIDLPINLSSTVVLVRKATTTTAGIRLHLTVNTVATTAPAGGVPIDLGGGGLASSTVAVAASRALTAADNGKVLELTAAGLTLTVPAGLPTTTFACRVISKGSSFVASFGGALLNDGTASIALGVGTYSIIGKASVANSYSVSSPAGALTPFAVAAASSAAVAWRPSTYFTIAAQGSLDIYTTPVTSVNPNLTKSVTDHNFVIPELVVRRGNRFRVWFTNGAPTTAGEAFTLNGKTEVPSKNSSGIQYLPWKFGGQDTYRVPAGGGARFCTDWMTWPLDDGDFIYHKGYCSNGGTAFLMPYFGSAGNPAAQNPTGKFTSARDNTGVDSSGVAYGTGTWASANFTGAYRPGMTETDSLPATRLVTVDALGDSITAGGAMRLSGPYFNLTMKRGKFPFLNLSLPSTSQNSLPIQAQQRMALARGDVGFPAHGRNSSDTAALLVQWQMMRGMGYRKLVQTLTTHFLPLSATVGGSSRGIQDFILANLGVGDGPDYIFPLRDICQTKRISTAEGGTITQASGSTSATVAGRALTVDDIGTTLLSSAGAYIGMILDVTSATTCTLSNTPSPSPFTNTSFEGWVWNSTQMGSVLTMTATKGSTDIVLGGTGTDYAEYATSAAVTATGGLIGRIASQTTLSEPALQSYSGSIGLTWARDGLHLNDRGNIAVDAHPQSDALIAWLKALTGL